MALKLRAQTRLRDWLGSAVPDKMVFLHVPKCGGTTISNYIRFCVGGKTSGGTAKLGEISAGMRPDERSIARARRARFVTGHFSWSALEQIALSDDVFVFSFLREPRSRLSSWHRMVSDFPIDHLNTHTRAIDTLCRGLSARDLFASENAEIRYFTDNFMVRQFSGHLTRYPVADPDWPDLLVAAKRNLASLDFVGLHERFDADMRNVLEMLRLPLLDTMPRDNVTALAARDDAGWDDETRAACAPLVRWDYELYGFAHSLRTGTNSTIRDRV